MNEIDDFEKKNPAAALSIESQAEIESAIRRACTREQGVIDANFLCQPVSVLQPKAPVCVKQTVSVGEVVEIIKAKKIGSILIVDEKGAVIGIFTERDCVQRVTGRFEEVKGDAIGTLMTPDPVVQPPDITIAFALNLMVHGGFRHLPLCAPDGQSLGIVSVRDVMDYLVSSFVEDLLGVETEGGEQGS